MCFNLSSQFVDAIEYIVHRCNGFRMSPSWSIYEVEHIVNISLQLLLRHIPVCGEYLVEHQVMFGCHLELFLPVYNLYSHKPHYVVDDILRCDAQSA
jgi:hypothetical protein